MVVGAVALAAACSSTRQDLETLQAENTTYLAMNFSCTYADATDVEFAALKSHPEQYAEKCIRTKAFSDSDFLYADAIMMQQPEPDSRGTLPTYWKDGDVMRRLHLGPSFVVIVGRVRSCDERVQMSQKAEDLRAQQAHETPHQIVPPGPHCRASGMAVFVSEAQIIPTAMD